MIIIQMSGGLGNQMFQYALYLKLKKLGREVKFDSTSSYIRDNARPIQLAVFNIQYPEATKEELIEMTDSSMLLKDRIRRKLKGRKSKEYREEGFGYDPVVLTQDPAYLVGTFQSELYFQDIKEQVREAFRFDQSVMQQETLAMKDTIQNTTSISIHVRRGDYLNAEEVYGEICTDAYYDGAIKYMLEKYPDATFYLFTNDLTWADFFVNARPFANIVVVKDNTEYTGYLDMYLMKHCKHNIIANSSFSWWAAWLNSHQEKTVIAPAKWLNSAECKDIYTEEMTLFDSEGRLVREAVQ